MADTSTSSEADTFKILIATDNHLGYAEKDPIRGLDSFETFREILEIANTEQVDFILLGGDMFHENRPSLRTLHSTINLLRTHCMGDKPCHFRMVSDQSRNFNTNCYSTVNVHDPNFNIGIPVFSIHGNHDDPVGEGNICALDLLSSAGLVNYFGKAANPDDIQIAPILLQKGETKLALYGLGSIRDERLHRTFLRGNVALTRPVVDPESWFNMFVIHQNRVEHGPKNFIPERFLNDFLDLVFWGHEHECVIDPEHNPTQEFYITQPGSSVATSLSEGESKKKHVGILRIEGRKFEIRKVHLKTVRPFIMDDIELSKVDFLAEKMLNSRAIESYLVNHVEGLLEVVNQKWKIDNPNSTTEPPLPLIRLRVEYSGGFSTFNPGRFGLQFANRIANPKDILNFYRSRKATGKKGKGTNISNSDIVRPTLPDSLDPARVDDLIAEFLEAQKLAVLPEKKFEKALRTFVEKDDRYALPNFLSRGLKETRSAAVENCKSNDMDSLKRELAEFKPVSKRKASKDAIDSMGDESNDEEKPAVAAVTKSRSSKPASDIEMSDPEPILDILSSPEQPQKKRGRSAAAAPKSKPKAAPKKKKPVQDFTSSASEGGGSEEEVISEVESEEAATTSRRKTPARSTAKKSPAKSSRKKPVDDDVILIMSSDIESDENKSSTSTKRRKGNTVPDSPPPRKRAATGKDLKQTSIKAHMGKKEPLSASAFTSKWPSRK